MVTSIFWSLLTKDTANFLIDSICLRHGTPEILISDNGVHFTARVIAELTEALGVEHRFSAPYHPECNGLTERMNGVISTALSMFVGLQQHKWDKYLPFVCFAINTSEHSVTGYSPFELVFARKPHTISDLVFGTGDGLDSVHNMRQKIDEYREQARLLIEAEQLKTKKIYDLKRREETFNENEKVLLKRMTREIGTAKKLTSAWVGPYQVIKQLTPVTYRIRDLRAGTPSRYREQTAHISRLRKYKLRDKDLEDGPRDSHDSQGGATRGGPHPEERLELPFRITEEIVVQEDSTAAEEEEEYHDIENGENSLDQQELDQLDPEEDLEEQNETEEENEVDSGEDELADSVPPLPGENSTSSPQGEDAQPSPYRTRAGRMPSKPKPFWLRDF